MALGKFFARRRYNIVDAAGIAAASALAAHDHLWAGLAVWTGSLIAGIILEAWTGMLTQ